MKIINILWTGGWDSTFRIIVLAQKKCIIQPYYIRDKRKSEKHELEAIKTITNDLRQNPTTKCIINDVITMNVTEIEVNSEITDSYENILKKDYFGSQYEWIARFAKINKNIELTIHKDDMAYKIIKKYGDVKKMVDYIKGEYYILDNGKSTKQLVDIFGNLHFPLLDFNKLEMKKMAENVNMIDLMNKTWFCHRPHNNKPCGICNPCIYTIEEGLKYRFSKYALLKYYDKKFVKKSILYKWLRGHIVTVLNLIMGKK